MDTTSAGPAVNRFMLQVFGSPAKIEVCAAGLTRTRFQGGGYFRQRLMWKGLTSCVACLFQIRIGLFKHSVGMTFKNSSQYALNTEHGSERCANTVLLRCRDSEVGDDGPRLACDPHQVLRFAHLVHWHSFREWTSYSFSPETQPLSGAPGAVQFSEPGQPSGCPTGSAAPLHPSVHV